MNAIPYATATVRDDGALVRVCPVCHLQIVEDHDATGEQTTNRYAEHYTREHECCVCDAPATITGRAGDGEWLPYCATCSAEDPYLTERRPQ